MKQENTDTKICKHCQSEIPKKAKVCPNCRKKQGGKLKWIIIAIVVIGIIGAAFGDGSENETASNNSASNSNEQQKEIEYMQVSVNDMVAALNENAAAASDTYKEKYLEVTGKLSNIDSNGDYISLDSDAEFSLINVQCFTKNEEQLEIVKTLKKGDMVTVKGKCTDVGEVLGFSLDIDSIVQ